MRLHQTQATSGGPPMQHRANFAHHSRQIPIIANTLPSSGLIVSTSPCPGLRNANLFRHYRLFECLSVFTHNEVN